jgi:hypothetical protein
MSDLAASGSVARGVRVGEGVGDVVSEVVGEVKGVGVGDGPACAETTKAQKTQPAPIGTTLKNGPRMVVNLLRSQSKRYATEVTERGGSRRVRPGRDPTLVVPAAGARA